MQKLPLLDISCISVHILDRRFQGGFPKNLGVRIDHGDS